MGFDPKDQEIIGLLTKLKNANGGYGEYPQDMFAIRRQGYLKQVAGLGLSAGLGTGIKNPIRTGKAAGAAPATSTLLEIVLVVALVVEASTVAYMYREKLVDVFQTFTHTQEVVSPPVNPSPLPTLGISQVPTETQTDTPTGTAIPGVTNNNGGGNTQVNSTLVPNGNNGNHFGQTPKPDVTKDNKNPDSTNNKDPQTK
jgi:hypothetical protein